MRISTLCQAAIKKKIFCTPQMEGFFIICGYQRERENREKPVTIDLAALHKE